MKIHPQVIVKNQIPEFVVLPYKEYKKLLDTLENQEDIREIKDFRHNKQQTHPLELLQRIADGEHPITVFRQVRELSQRQLAKAVGISPQYIHQIERGQRKGHIKTLKKIASILDVDVDLLI